METVSKLIARIGGVTAVARRFVPPLPVTTVSAWKTRNRIPPRYWPTIIKIGGGAIDSEVLMRAAAQSSAHDRTPLQIKDESATLAVRRLAEARNVSLAEAIRSACQEALERDRRSSPVGELLAGVHARVGAARRTGQRADKGFFDREWEERE